jgi:hypothetical protein
MGVGPPAAFSSFFSHFVMSFPGGSNTSGFWSGGLLWYISSSASGLILLADCQPFRTISPDSCVQPRASRDLKDSPVS